jgi:hypothetical protein
MEQIQMLVVQQQTKQQTDKTFEQILRDFKMAKPYGRKTNRNRNTYRVKTLIEGLEKQPDRSINSLDLTYCKLSDYHLAMVVQAFLKKSTKTAIVALVGNEVSTLTIKALCSSPLSFGTLLISVKELSQPAFTLFIEALKSPLCELESLEFRGTHLLKPNFAPNMASVLRVNQTLKILDLTYCELGENGVKEFDKSCFHHLEEIRFGDDFEAFSPNVFKNLLDGMSESHGIERCRFNYHKIGNTSARLIGSFIGKKANLKTLVLPFAKIDDDALKCIFQGIANCAGFQDLVFKQGIYNFQSRVEDLCAIIRGHPSLINATVGGHLGTHNNLALMREIERSHDPTSKILSALCSVRIIPRVGQMATIKQLPNDCYIRLKGFLI